MAEGRAGRTPHLQDRGGAGWGGGGAQQAGPPHHHPLIYRGWWWGGLFWRLPISMVEWKWGRWDWLEVAVSRSSKRSVAMPDDSPLRDSNRVRVFSTGRTRVGGPTWSRNRSHQLLGEASHDIECVLAIVAPGKPKRSRIIALIDRVLARPRGIARALARLRRALAALCRDRHIDRVHASR